MISFLISRLPFRACTISCRKPLADNLLADEAFGISVAPAEFQRMIDDNLGGLEGVKAIVDDVLIWGDGDSFEEATASHDENNCLFC